MNCDGCGHLNAPTARFCAQCGTALLRRCPACDAEQTPDARFCDQCGASLGSGAADDPAPPSQSSAVRKQVTALFADLVGSTAFGERVDPEAARAALTPYFEILRATVEDHGGTVVKFTGDGVFAVFGLPEVAEDDARRAVAAGQDLQRRFGAFAATVRDRHGVELGLRVGVNSGELVVGDDDEDLVGDVLNTAARLEAACAPGRVLVGEDTWRLTRSGVRYEVLGEISVKGKSEPIATFQVAELPDAAIEEHIPFVGRDAELAQLLDAFGEARDSPVLRLVTVVGDPGVGKTRLASEVRGATSARSFDLRFERRGSTTFGPIADLLRLVTDGTADGVARLFQEHDERDRLVPILASMLGHDAARSTEESFWGVRRLLEHLTEQHGPLLVVVDDIQWAEPLFWDLLDHLVEWTEAPVLVIALARPELRELRPELTQAGRRVAASIALDGLGADDTRELAARLLDVEELPRDLTDRIPASTDGNPLFVRELVNMLVDDGTLERDGDRWRLTIDADAIDVPPTILSLLASRVERLPDDERRAIELASVIGTDFDRGTLAAIAAEDGSTGPLGVVLDRLRRRDLVEPSGSWSGDHPVYRFHHVLVRDAAYRRLLKQRRATLHELVGRHVDEHHPGGDETDVVVAHHFEQVVRYRRDLGTVDAATAELARDAVERLRKAADSSLAREDLPAAGSAAQRALDLVGEDSAERDELLLIGCEALLSSGDVGAAEPLVSELAERSTDDRLAAWADCFRSQRWSLTDPDRLSEATDIADRAADALASLGDAAGVAKARLVRAGCLARLGRVGECENELDLALGAARDAGDRRRTVAVLGAAPLAALWGPSPVSRAGGRCLDVLRLLRITTASPAVETTSIRCQAVLEALRGRLDSARDKLEQSRSTSQELGLRQGLFETELFAGFVELWAGEPGAAEPHLRAAHDGLGRLGIGADAGQAAALLARALLDRGDLDAADALATEAFASAGQNLQTAVASRSALAEVRAAQGRHDEAAALAAEAVEIAARTDIVLDHALAVEAVGRVARQAGDLGAAAAAQSDARRLLADKGVTLERGSGPDREPAPELPRVERPKAEPEGEPDAGRPTSVSRPGRDRRRGLTEVARPSIPPVESSGWDVIETAVGAWLDDDEAAWRRCYAADFLGAGRELLSPHRSDVRLDEWATASFDLRRRVSEIDVTVERVVQRGEHWFVSRDVGTADGDEIGYVFVSQVVDGRIRRETIFDPSQLDEAIALADDGFDVENGIGDLAWIRDLRAVMYSVDPEVLEQRFTDDYVQRDRRQMGWHDLTRDDLIGAIRDNPDPFLVSVPMVWRFSESGVVCYRVETTPDGASVSGWLAVAEFRDRLVHRMDIFDEDDLAGALARYDEVTSSRVWRWNLDFSERMLAGDRDGYDRMFSPDATFEVRRVSSPPFAGPIGVFIDERIMSWVDVGVESIDSDPIEEHGDDRCLIRATVTTTAGDRRSMIFLNELDAEGRGARFISFDHDQIVDALAELRSVTVDPNDPVSSLDAGREAVEPGRRAYVDRVSLAIAVGPLDVFAACFAPDFVVVDRRAMGLGTRDLAAFIESNTALVGNVIAWTAETLETTPTAETIETSDTAALTRVEVRSTVDESSWAMLLLTEYAGSDDDALITRWTQFDVDDRAAAIEAFRALGAGVAGLPDRRWVERGGSAELAEISRRWRDAVVKPVLDRADPPVSDDVAIIDHRPSGQGRRSLDEYLESTGSVATVEEWHVVRYFDERPPFHFAQERVVSDADGSIREMLKVCRRDGAEIVEVHEFDLDQFDEAHGLFDALTSPADHPDVPQLARPQRNEAWSIVEAYAQAWTERDRYRMRALLTDDYEHRGRNGVLDLDADASVDYSLREHIYPDGSGRERRLLAVRGDHLCLDMEKVPFEDDVLARFCVWESVDGRARRVDRFGTDQLADAYQRLDERYREIVAESASAAPIHPPELTNEANEIGLQFIDARDRGDWDAALGLAHPDLEARQHRAQHRALGLPSRTDRAGFLDGLRNSATRISDVVQGLPQLAGREVLAVRGDDLVLSRSVETIDGNEWPYLTLLECRDGQIVALDQWSPEQLGEAARELDRRWMELAGGPLDDFARRFGVAYSEGDVTALEQLLSPSFERVDHRPLRMGRRDRAAFLQSTVLSLEREMVLLIRQTIAATDRCSFDAAAGFSGDDEMFDGLTIRLLNDDGRLELQEAFELTQFEQARRRFDELTSNVAADDGRWPFELTNREVELSRENLCIWPHDAEHVDRFFEPGFEWIVRRTGSIKRSGGLATYLETTEFWTLVDATIELEVLAVRGDDLSLKRYTVRTASGDEQEIYNVAELGPTGRWSRIVVFGEDQLGEAVVELEQRWFELNGTPFDDFGRRWVAAHLSRDIAEVERLLAPSFETVDHRSIGLGRRSRAGYLESTAPVLELGVVCVFGRSIETDDRCGLTLASALVGDDVVFEGFTLTLLDDEGRAELTETFDITQLDEARRRFRELVFADPPRALSNAASELGRRMWEAGERRDLDTFAAQLHPDFEFEELGTAAAALGVPKVGRDDYLSDFAQYVEQADLDALRLVRRTVVAIRGDDLAVPVATERRDGYDHANAGLLERVDGKIRWLGRWGEGGLDDALDELDRRWVERGGPAPLIEVMTEFRRLGREGGADAVEAFVSPELESVDHRSLGMRVRGYREWVGSMTPAAGGFDFLMRDVLEHTEHIGLISGTVLQEADDLRRELLCVLRVDAEGRVDRHDIFERFDLERARRRYEELVAESASDGNGTTPTLGNDATDLVTRLWSEAGRGDVSGAAALLHPNFVNEQNGAAAAVLGVEPRPLGGYVSDFADLVEEVDGDVSRLIDRTVIAVRGDDLEVAITTEGRDGYEWSWVALGELTDGLISRFSIRSETELHDALDELDRHWVARGGPAALVEVMTRFRELSRSGDVAGVEAFVSLDLESVDHRALGMGVRGYREWVDSMTPLAGRCEFVMHEVLAHTDRIGLIRGTVSQAEDGSWELLYLLRVDGDGRVDRYEIFDWSDVDLARARFEELVAESDDVARSGDFGRRGAR